MARTIEAPIADDLDATGAPRCRRLFSIEQAADYAGVSPEVILYWIRIGWLEAYRVHDEQLRIDQAELDACLASLVWQPCEPMG